ncbi:hypothetical protein [Psilogramma increta granulovirus]|uniref:Uncharacterized protein n=1 Tax=Psilogramma increta granulovirus TaxID=2953508 RepID=A0A977XV23_9BBAC|nr:hypothetical protein [Psilogramma increta granulovirus]
MNTPPLPTNVIYKPTTVEVPTTNNTSTSCEIFCNACVFVVITMLFLVLTYLYYIQNL